MDVGAVGGGVVVMEVMELGEGGSGGNGGQVIPGLKYDPDTLETLYPGDQGAKLVATVAAGPDLVFELIRKHDIGCEAVRNGWLQLATSESALGPIGTRVRQWQARGAAVEMLSAAEVARLTGSQRYYGGLTDRPGA